MNKEIKQKKIKTGKSTKVKERSVVHLVLNPLDMVIGKRKVFVTTSSLISSIFY